MRHQCHRAVGSHPLDFMAATMRIPADETALVGTLRGEPVPLVKSLTNDIRVPADAEVILEGYLCAEAYVEPEGPFGEYMGYYGPMHLDPIFHVTAITMRKDALHQSVLHGAGRVLGRVESANFVAIHLEARAFDILEKLGIDIREARVTTSSGEGQHLRIAICQTAPGQARQAIEALFAELRNEGRLIRNEDGQYYLGAGQKGKTHLDHEPHKEKRSAK